MRRFVVAFPEHAENKACNNKGELHLATSCVNIEL